MMFSHPQRILLIEPPFYRFFGYERWHYPITLALLGTYLAEQGNEVLIYDADKPTTECRSLNRSEVRKHYPLYGKALENKNHPIWLETDRIIQDFKPDIIGLTSITAKIESADMIAMRARALLGGKVKIVLGGPHVQGMRAIDPNYQFGLQYDDVVTSVPKLVDRKPDKRLIFDYQSYSAANFSFLLTSSGCPNACSFCCHSFNKQIVYRDHGSVSEEVLEIREAFQGHESVYIADDCLFSNTRHFEGICQIFRAADMRFTAGSRIMALTPEKIDTFVSSGGKRIMVGVESGSQRVLDRIRKKLRVEETIKRTRWLNDAGIPWSAFIVVGFPFETIEDLKKTEELLYMIQPTFASINRLTPYPGTEIYKEFVGSRSVPFRDLYQLNCNSYFRLSDGNEEYIDRMFRDFDAYNRKNQN